MEQILQSNEIGLSPWCLDIQVTNGCIEEDCEIKLGGVAEKWVFKAFNDIMYNQLEVHPFSCFLVWPFTALSNFSNKKIWYDVMIKALQELRNIGKFSPDVGWYLKDWVAMACKYFNASMWTNIKALEIDLNDENVVSALKKKSMITTGIKYWDKYFKNEQDDWRIQNTLWTVWNHWHCMNFGKANTTDEQLWMQNKLVEQYLGKLTYNIIWAQLNNPRSLFFNKGFYYYV